MPNESKSGVDLRDSVEVPRDQWEVFLNGFSVIHHQWIVTVEVLGREGEREVEVRERPFTGASVHHPGPADKRIVIGLADTGPDNHLEHSIINPIRLALTGNGDDLIINDSDGTTTIVHFVRALDPANPSLVAA
jgi:Family of unknown function (DUF5335)